MTLHRYRVSGYQEGIDTINANPYANGTAIFTRDGGAARQFQFDIDVGMVGINVPIPVPVSYYSFGGWRNSLFGDLHMYGPEGVQFYTQSKQGLPRHFENIMALMRILPVRVFDGMIRRHIRHCFGSFSFASVGTGFFEQGRFCGLGVSNVFHMPQVPPQVGIGFFFNQYRGRINIGVSFREGLVDAAGQRKILSILRELG